MIACLHFGCVVELNSSDCPPTCLSTPAPGLPPPLLQLPQESKGLAERAYHPEEINANPALRVDTQYYLAQQVDSGWQCMG